MATTSPHAHRGHRRTPSGVAANNERLQELVAWPALQKDAKSFEKWEKELQRSYKRLHGAVRVSVLAGGLRCCVLRRDLLRPNDFSIAAAIAHTRTSLRTHAHHCAHTHIQTLFHFGVWSNDYITFLPAIFLFSFFSSD